MQAIIMAGGFGSRLKPLTNDIPKPMVNIINKPIIEFIIQYLASYDIKDIIITLGYMPEKIIKHCGDGSKWGVKITYLVEKTPLGTAGGVKQAQSIINDDFFVLSGDAFCNIDLNEMRNYFKQKKKLGTIAVKNVKDARGFGLINMDETGKIVSFLEKPKAKIEGLVNMGIYCFDKKVLDYIPQGKYDFSLDLFPKIIDKLTAYQTKCFWSDIGTLSSYYLTNNHVALHPKEFGFCW